MQWLKNIIGEEAYNALDSKTLEILKTKLGDTEYIQNDPTKIIPKHVFNEKLEKIKLLEAQNEQYKNQLNNVGDMVTSSEMKTKLETQKLEFEQTIQELNVKYEEEKIRDQKKNLIEKELMSSGCKYPDLMLDKINMDDVIVKDDKILNSDKILLPLKETYKTVFEKSLNSNNPSVPVNNNTVNSSNLNNSSTSTQDLIKKHDELVAKNADFTQIQNLRRQIKQSQQTQE